MNLGSKIALFFKVWDVYVKGQNALYCNNKGLLYRIFFPITPSFRQGSLAIKLSNSSYNFLLDVNFKNLIIELNILNMYVKFHSNLFNQ